MRIWMRLVDPPQRQQLAETHFTRTPLRFFIIFLFFSLINNGEGAFGASFGEHQHAYISSADGAASSSPVQGSV